MKKKKKKLKKIAIIGILSFFIVAVLGFGFFKNQKIFSEETDFYNLIPKKEMESNINVEEIRKKIDTMTLKEIEETIFQIEKEIEKLNLKLIEK
jgi:hypothetical protein